MIPIISDQPPTSGLALKAGTIHANRGSRLLRTLRDRAHDSDSPSTGMTILASRRTDNVSGLHDWARVARVGFRYPGPVTHMLC